MNGRTASEYTGVEEIRVLVFDTMGTRMAVDVDQIAEMIDPARAEAGEIHVVPIHERLSFRSGDASYDMPRVLVLKDSVDDHGVMIDRPEDIRSIRTECIQALPPLIEAVMKSRAIWGVCLLEGEIVLLIDLNGGERADDP